MCVPWPSAVPCVPCRATCEDAHYWRLPSEGVGDATGFELRQQGALASRLGFEIFEAEACYDCRGDCLVSRGCPCGFEAQARHALGRVFVCAL